MKERTMTPAVANPGKSLPMVPTLLGCSAVRIPTAGRIRAGIKVLTRKAAEHTRAREIYDAGVAESRSFDSIERAIAEAVPELKNPLTPKNVPYFTVRGGDFPNPEIAHQIMELYAEDRGEGRRLYRFPVVFPADVWQHVMPHELVTWTARERRYWSEYSDDGQTRYCKTHEAVPVDGNGRTTVRLFGGRKIVLRPENGGLCDPEACPEYQARQCNLSGRLIFFIPGIKSISAFDLATNSFYAMQAAIEKFQTISFMRGGRISGFLDGRHTPFFITKRLTEISRIADDGRPTRVAQWLIDLEAPIDVSALLRSDDGLEAVQSRAGEAVAVLEGPPSVPGRVVDEDGVISDANGAPVSRSPLPSGAAPAGEEDRRSASAARGPAQSSTTAISTAHRSGRESAAARTTTTPTPLPAQRQATEKAAGDELEWLFDASAALGVASDRFEAYASKRWGKGWKLAAGGRKRALDELSQFADDAVAYQQKVTAELDVWA
jgi:Recombination directionality factor-like